MSIRRFALAAVAALLLPSVGHAQDTSATPTYGHHDLSAYFTPDPYRVNVTSGGSLSASSAVSSECAGYMANAADVELTYTSGTLPLYLRTESTSDTTLIVNAPDGRWYCDDDGGDGSNAQLMFSPAQTGTYDIWVGSYAEGGGTSAQLLVSELSADATTDTTPQPEPDPAPVPQSAPQLLIDASRDATYSTISLASGFTPDPRRVSMRAGGRIEASSVSDQCNGYVARAPDVRIHYTAGSQPLILRTQSDADTTLMVLDPEGVWTCDDDSAATGSNAEIFFDKPAAGDYVVWVGTFDPNRGSAATLLLTEREE